MDNFGKKKKRRRSLSHLHLVQLLEHTNTQTEIGPWERNLFSLLKL